MPPSDALEPRTEPSIGPDEDAGFRPTLFDWRHRLGRWLFRRRPEGDDDLTSLESRARFRNVCISREAGAGGGTVARLLGTRLKWKVYDHELLEAIAQGMEISTEDARAYDELAPSLIQDWLLPLREEHYAPQEAYLDHLAKLVHSIGRAGDSILVGRAPRSCFPATRPSPSASSPPFRPAPAGSPSASASPSAPPAAPPATSTAAAPDSSAPSTAPTPTTPTSMTWSLILTPSASPSPLTSSPPPSNPAVLGLRKLRQTKILRNTVTIRRGGLIR